MSLMGYEEDQILYMMAGINLAKHYLPPSKDDVMNSLDMTFNFLDGLLAEGHIQ